MRGWFLKLASAFFAFSIGLVVFVHPPVEASGNKHIVTYEEFLGMVNDPDNTDCYERAHDTRRSKPSGTFGGIVYDYSQLPDPRDMIFVCVNDKFLPTDVPVEIENGFTLMPMRALFEALGATVKWNAATETVTAVLDQSVMELTVNKRTARVNGEEVAMDVPARTIRGRVYVPLRFVSKHLGRAVVWQPENRIVKVFSYPELSVTPIPVPDEHRTKDYVYTNYFRPATRFLLYQNGEIHWLLQAGDKIHVHIFDESFRKKGEAVLRAELPKFGGAHAGDDGNFYLVFGQDNMAESDDVTVYRVVKYDRRWNKIAHVDVKGVYVRKPFHASNLTMASRNGVLVVYSARERYTSEDGLNHQSNIPVHIRMDDMTILYAGGQWPRNHVSHSFANYVKFDGERIVYLDHGDAYPRSIYLQVEESGRIAQEVNLISFPGKTGDNYTGATLGGLEVSNDHYLAVGTYIKPGSKTKQLFLASVPKQAETDEGVNLVYLTGPSDPSVTETHIIKLNEDRFVLIWSDAGSRRNVSYAVTDGRGRMVGKPKRLENIAPPGHLEPLVLNGKIIWYFYEMFPINKEIKAEFYSLKIQP